MIIVIDECARHQINKLCNGLHSLAGPSHNYKVLILQAGTTDDEIINFAKRLLIIDSKITILSGDKNFYNHWKFYGQFYSVIYITSKHILRRVLYECLQQISSSQEPLSFKLSRKENKNTELEDVEKVL